MADSTKKKDDGTATSQLFVGLMNNAKFSDAKFIVGDEEKEFIAHRCVLAHRSPVFQTMFLSSMREAYSPDDIRVEDVTVDAFDFILRFIYTGQASDRNVSQIPDILYAARKYQVEGAEPVCLEVLSNKLAIENVLETFAALYGTFDEAAEKCLAFIMANIQEILEDPKGTGFVHVSPKCVDVILSEPFYIQYELVVYRALKCWLSHDTDNRQEHMTGGTQLLYHVRLVDLDVVELMGEVKSSGLLSDESILKVLEFKCSKNGDCSGFLGKMHPQAEHPNCIAKWNITILTAWLQNGIPGFKHYELRQDAIFNPRRLACVGGFYIQWLLGHNNTGRKFNPLPKMCTAFNSEFADQIHLKRGFSARCSFSTGIKRYTVKDINAVDVRFWGTFIRNKGKENERRRDWVDVNTMALQNEYWMWTYNNDSIDTFYNADRR
eukprot:1157907_1